MTIDGIEYKKCDMCGKICAKLEMVQHKTCKECVISELEKKLETAKKILLGLVDGVVLYSDDAFKASKAEAEEFLQEQE